MSEEQRVYRCLICGKSTYPLGRLPDACPACGARWLEPAVAIVEREPPEFQRPDGSSVIRCG